MCSRYKCEHSLYKSNTCFYFNSALVLLNQLFEVYSILRTLLLTSGEPALCLLMLPGEASTSISDIAVDWYVRLAAPCHQGASGGAQGQWRFRKKWDPLHLDVHLYTFLVHLAIPMEHPLDCSWSKIK